jgi:CarboxypepD_reg-like domain/TonB-dependent Receptor Plug Domain
MNKTIFVFCFLVSNSLFAQAISGFVKDKNTGESIIGATVRIEGSLLAAVTNTYGYFSLATPDSNVELKITSVGYKPLVIKVSQLNQKVLIELEEFTELLNEIEVVGSKETQSLDRVPIGVTSIPISRLKAVPVLFGEADILKALALTPGVSTANEGTTGILVRGGTPDQNLILLDETPVYNVSHLFGLVSVFNPDAIKNVTLYKSSFPARFGGRLSSVIDINVKEGSSKKRNLEIGVGLINSRLLFEGPIMKNKPNSPTFFLSARFSNLALALLPTYFSYLNNAFGSYFNYSLYDINFKVNKRFKNRSQLFWSTYAGNDLWLVKEKQGEAGNLNNAALKWGNLTSSLRYIYPINQRLFFKSTTAYTQYHYGVKTENIKDRKVIDFIDSKTTIQDILLKPSFEFYINPNHELQFGTDLTRHFFTPVDIKTTYNIVNEANSKQVKSFESGTYLETKNKLNSWLDISSGLRFASLNVNSDRFNSWEPRVAANFNLSNSLSFKLGYAKMKQFIHLLNSSSGGLPNDLWIPATGDIVPQSSTQFTASISKNIFNGFSFSLEGYSKFFKNVIEYKDGVNYLTNSGESYVDLIEKEGLGKAHGLELFVDKNKGKFTGWFSYSLAWNYRKFKNINQNNWYAANFDRRHIIALVGNYKINKAIDISSNWLFQSGSPTTVPIALIRNPIYDSFFRPIPIYADRNNYRMPAFHRLDFSINFKKETNKGNLRTWTLGVYNVYNQANPFYLDVKTNYIYSKQNSSSSRATTLGYNNQLVKKSVIPFLPFVNYSLILK